MFRVFQDDQGFVTILVKHKSPYIAKEWIELIVQEINYFYRIKDKVEAQAAVEYLNIQMAQTSFTEIKEVIAQIVQTKTQQLALIKVNDFYVFEYIDPPAVILESNEPARTLICILGALTGLLIGILIALIRYFSFTKK
jgi:LPS O-antigen subunit length determinant protein (WzzB/FepE family)